MTRKALMLLATVALMVVAATAVATAATPTGQAQSATHIKAHLEPVGGSGVHGTVHLFQLPTEGTQIVVFAKGLTPGKRYLSLYYDNPRCAIEPYEEEDVIGGPYTAIVGGFGFTTGTADDDLDEIKSVSVRSARTFKLLACARVH
ncbi:MAG: hypothetical protein H0V21_11485 [Rubrobacter sp.]|nr:hypothetical protein [Rubrobacter sp.]